MKKILLILFVVTIIPFNSFCQRNYELMFNDYSINFYDVCEEADEYFKENDKNIRGSGWKKYQRWRNANEYKYYPSGNRENIDPYFSVNAYKDFLVNNPSTENLLNGWKELGPVIVDSCNGGYNPGLGRVECFYVDPSNQNTIYLGSRSGGFWKTNDGGNSWGNSTDFLFASGVNTIDASPANPDSILINVRDANNGITHGIYRSVDGGDNWSVTNFNPTNLGQGGLGSYFSISRIAYHPTIPNLIFIRTSAGLYRSDDNLQSWSLLSTSISKFEFHPNNPNIMYAYSGNSFYISNDAGSSFNLQSTIPVTPSFISVSSNCYDCVYLLYSYDGMWKSLDQGVNYTFMDSCIIPSYANWKGGFAVNDIDTSNIIYGGTEIMASLDGGQSFNMTTSWTLSNSLHGGGSYTNRLQNSLHYPHADLRCAKSINGTFYVGTDGFLSKSIDNGNTWQILSQGTAIRENYKLGVSQSNTYRSISGSQDNGSSIKHKDTWIEFYGADGMEALVHPLNDDWMIASWQNGGRRRTQDGGINGSWIFDEDGAWEAPITYDPNNQMRIYDFSDSIYVSEDFGSNWLYQGKASTFASSIRQSAIAENNSDIVLISSSGTIEKSIDGGINFSDISNNLPGDYITDIAFDPNNDDIIIVTYATWQNNGDKVYITTDGGNSWSNITYNLGNMPIHSVVIDHTNSSNIYLGAEIGIYTKPMNSTTWSLYNPFLPNTTIQELEIVYGSNTIKAATWGRGLWEFDLVGRSDFPSILTTRITDMPTEILPQESINQYVTSVISYVNPLSSIFVEWSINTNTNIISMINTQDSTWVSQNPIPNYAAGTKIYFKVFAVGNNNDTSETYRFMYTVQPGAGNSLSVLFNTTDVTCYGGNDGSATINISGGVPPYSFNWSNGQTTQTINNLSSGNYYCTSTDINGTSITSNVVISQPLILSSTSNTSDVSCYGDNDGSATLTLSGGTGTLTVNWFGMNPTALPAGTHNYTVTDANGCSITSNVVISQPNELIVSITQNNTSLIVNLLGGTPNYVYSWVGPFGFTSSNQSILPSTNGQYTVLVTDANGCESETNFNVTWISTSLEIINILNFNIFPNPSDNNFNIEFNSLINQNVTLRVFNSVGDVIFIDNLESYIGEYKKQISLKEYSKAIYLLEIQTDDGIVNKKLILQ